MKHKTITSPATKSIALVAHDNRKPLLIDWCLEHKDKLSKHKLFATGTSGSKVQAATQLPVNNLISGPLGGDQQIGAKMLSDEKWLNQTLPRSPRLGRGPEMTPDLTTQQTATPRGVLITPQTFSSLTSATFAAFDLISILLNTTSPPLNLTFFS